jgi:uncharacterized membrane protein YdjX (TVP38/TMEM64 family)
MIFHFFAEQTNKTKQEVAEFLGKDGQLRAFVKKVGWYGPLVYAGVYVICTVCFVPGTILTLAAGVVFPEVRRKT